MMTKKKVIKAADLFCGAGGTSTGLIQACHDLGYKVELTAINHWDTAIATHTQNHPDVRHLCANLDNVNPRDLFKEGELDLLWASPECTHHSNARGGKPVSDQSRSTAWCVVRWAEALRPSIILVENVREFENWGPIGSNNKPLKSRRGEIFHAWVNCMTALGYRVEWRKLVAADYGDPTTRERLFVYAVRGRRSIIWPEPSHSQDGGTDLFSSRKKWVPAKQIIDWSLEGKSIFKRKKPLAEKTLNRIMIGLEKYGLKPFIMGAGGPTGSGRPSSVEKPMKAVLTENHSYLANPYLVHLRGTGTANDLGKPAPAVTAGGQHLGLAQPYLVQTNHAGGGECRTRPLDKPMPTVVANNGGEWAMVEPMLLGQQSGAAARPVSEPAPTVATSGAIALIEPFLVGAGGPERAGEPYQVSRPMRTVLTRQSTALVEPYLITIDHQSGKNGAQPASKPIGAVTTKARHAVCEPYLVEYYGKSNAQGIDDPIGTVTTKERHAVCEPSLIKFYSSGGQHQSIDKPLGTVTAQDRFGLVMPVVEIEGERFLLDIRFRMLKPHELAAAQGFPKNYKFKGKSRHVVKQIGNSVPVNLSKALVRAALQQA